MKFGGMEELGFHRRRIMALNANEMRYLGLVARLKIIEDAFVTDNLSRLTGVNFSERRAALNELRELLNEDDKIYADTALRLLDRIESES
jgi:hypothetical protein